MYFFIPGIYTGLSVCGFKLQMREWAESVNIHSLVVVFSHRKLHQTECPSVCKIFSYPQTGQDWDVARLCPVTRHVELFGSVINFVHLEDGVFLAVPMVYCINVIRILSRPFFRSLVNGDCVYSSVSLVLFGDS